MEIIVLGDSLEVARLGAQRIRELIDKKPTAVLGLATGSTPIELYRELIRLHEENKISFRQVKTFNLDEYIGIEPTSPQSYRAFMQRELFDAIDIAVNNTHLPTCDAHTNPCKAGAAYEKAIVQAGGIDLQILGIGQNGHIGFNEPTSSFASRTRVKTLAPSTVAANGRLFDVGEFQPNLAMTMGIATILDSRIAILLATGSKKAQAVRDAIEGPLSSMCPASALQLHRKATFVLDEAAASKLSGTEYYRWVYKQNCELMSEFGRSASLG